MEFREGYRKLMSRLGVFRTSEEFEVQKTVASIDTLLRRADDLYRGAVPVYNEGLDIENLKNRAIAHLEALERGERPLAGRFTEPGVAFVDHSFFEHDGRFYMMYTGVNKNKRPCKQAGGVAGVCHAIRIPLRCILMDGCRRLITQQ